MSVDGKPFTVEKVDDLTFRVTTPDIYAPFLLFMGDVEVLPKHKLEAAYRDGTLMKKWTIATAQETPKEIASSGPFVIRYYRPGERIVFEPNPYYYRFDSKGQRLPYVDYYVTKFVKDANASVVAFATGLTDSEGVGPDNVGWVQRGVKTYHFTMYDRGPSTASSFICFNENPGHDKNGKPFVTPYKLKWFTNQKFRQAISYGIDRQGLVQGVLFGRGAPLWGPESPTNHKWFNPHVKQYPYDPKKALELLESQGFRRDKNGDLRDADGNKVEFGLMTNAENPIRQNMATVFKENMAALGINVRLQFLDFGTFVGKLQDSYDYEACMIGFTGGGDPVGGMSIYVSKGRLHQWYPNQKTPATPWEARMDELMMKQLKTLDEKKRQEYYFEVQQIMSEELPLIYLVTPNAYQGVKDKWQNVQIAPTGPVFRVDEVWGKQ
jgi:peptide/nickel transport system substrate-binding protein